MTTDDELAISILRTIAQTQLAPAAGDLPPNPELRSALATAFDSPGLASASEGDLARAALALLRQDPVFAEPIQLVVSQADILAPRPGIGGYEARQRYLEPSTIGLVTAALFALQTRIKFKKDHTGKWFLEVDKKSSGDAVVKLLVQHLLPFLRK